MNAEGPVAETSTTRTENATLYRRLATSQGVLPRLLRRTYWAVLTFSLPAPKVVVRPLLLLVLATRGIYHFLLRVFICEPVFKAYCKKYGRNLHTDRHIHWVRGDGDIIAGDNVVVDGKVTINFAARFADRPTLEIGDNTGIGHDCMFTIGKRISIGRNCNLSSGTTIIDSNGHDTDPQSRWALKPPEPENVRPVVIADGVWIGMRCMIFPGVKIGEGSVISAGSVVRTHVPPYSVVAGNPAKVMFRLKKPDPQAQAK